MSTYDDQAAAFLASTGLTLKIARVGEVYKWGDTRNQYKVTVKHADGRKMQFQFFGSVNDYQQGNDPTAYEVLSTLASEGNAPETVADYFSEFGGDEDSKAETALARKVIAFGRRIREFFSPAEFTALSTIQ